MRHGTIEENYVLNKCRNGALQFRDPSNNATYTYKYKYIYICRYIQRERLRSPSAIIDFISHIAYIIYTIYIIYIIYIYI